MVVEAVSERDMDSEADGGRAVSRRADIADDRCGVNYRRGGINDGSGLNVNGLRYHDGGGLGDGRCHRDGGRIGNHRGGLRDHLNWRGLVDYGLRRGGLINDLLDGHRLIDDRLLDDHGGRGCIIDRGRLEGLGEDEPACQSGENLAGGGPFPITGVGLWHRYSEHGHCCYCRNHCFHISTRGWTAPTSRYSGARLWRIKDPKLFAIQVLGNFRAHELVRS